MKTLKRFLFTAVGFAILIGTLVLGGLQVVRADTPGVSCRCFTSEMIDAGFVSLGFNNVSNPVVDKDCSGPEGTGLERHETEFQITLFDQTNLAAGTGFGLEPPPENPPPALGGCSLGVERGVSLFELSTGVDELSAAEVAACQQEILQSLTWAQFCANDGE